MKYRRLSLILPLLFLLISFALAACGAPKQLSAPANLKIEDNVLSWDAVEYADGYSVYFKDTEYETAECSFALPKLKDTELYEIEVMAFSNTGINHSEYSVVTYAGKYAVPTEGLRFELIANSENSDECAVVGFAADANGICVVPAFYGGLRVASLSPKQSDPALAQVKSLYLPNTMNGNIFRSDIFEKFPNLENIELESGLLRYESRGNCVIDREENAVAVGCVNSAIPDDVTKIASNAFAGRRLQALFIPKNITAIEDYAFTSCTFGTVFYEGTKEEWNEKVTIGETGNNAFLSSLSYYSENAPSESGNFWHYVDGVPTKW